MKQRNHMQSSTPYPYFSTLYIVADPTIAGLSQEFQKTSPHTTGMLQDVYTINKKVPLDDPLTPDRFLSTNMHGSHTCYTRSSWWIPSREIENLYLQETTTILSKRELCNTWSFATFPWSLKGIIEHKGSHKGNVHHNHHKGNYNCFSSLCSCSWYSFSWYVIQPQLSLTLPQWRSKPYL